MKMNNLERIFNATNEDDAFLSAWVLDNIKAIHLALSKSKTVHAIRDGLANGTIDKEQIYNFVGFLLRALRIGERFPHDLEIAAVCVAMEKFSPVFVDQFIEDLADVQLHEMRKSAGVARISKGRRAWLTGDVVKVDCLAITDQPNQEIAWCIVDTCQSQNLAYWPENRNEPTSDLRFLSTGKDFQTTREVA